MTDKLLLASPGGVGADTERRVIAGLVVPFGPAGDTSGGRLSFAAGSLAVSAARRVKLLTEHDQRDPVGPASLLEEVTAEQADERLAAMGADPVGLPGLWAEFAVPEDPSGDLALANVKSGKRDAFSVGVQLDDASLTNLRRAKPGTVVAGRGRLREVSLVTVPAFDDARGAAAAAGDLVVSSWTPQTPSAAGAGDTPERGSTVDDTTTTAGAETTQATSTATTTPEQPATASAVTSTASAPAVVPAVAGGAFVTSEPSTYGFSGDSEHSIITDLLAANLRHDSEAYARVERFNAELREGNPASVQTFITAAATRDNVDGAGTDLPSFFQPSPNRPDLMRALVDVKRPFINRLDRIPISNAQPFAIPKVGEFTGVGPHTEGTPHRAAGTLTLGGDTMQPTATSGAWEASRELLDAANPVLDRIAARAMLRDYQRQTEGKIIALLAARAAQNDAAANVYGVDTLLELRAAMIDFVNDDEEGADIVAVSRGLLRTFGLDTDATDRPQLPFVTPVNAVGSIRPGYTGFGIDGVEVFRSSRLDAGVTGANVGTNDVGVLARSEGILWAESSVLQFRFDEVLGPGVIKLALWAYSGAAILDTADVQIVQSGADPTA